MVCGLLSDQAALRREALSFVSCMALLGSASDLRIRSAESYKCIHYLLIHLVTC